MVTGFRAKFNRKAQNPSGKHPPCRCLVPSPAPRLLQGGGCFPGYSTGPPSSLVLLVLQAELFVALAVLFPPSLFSHACSKSPSKSSNTDYFSMQMRLIFQGKRKNVDHVRDAQKIAPPTRGSPAHFSLTRFPSFLTCPFIPSSLSRSHQSCRS